MGRDVGGGYWKYYLLCFSVDSGTMEKVMQSQGLVTSNPLLNNFVMIFSLCHKQGKKNHSYFHKVTKVVTRSCL